MPKVTIWSVHQRSLASDVERELGMYTDDNMANQAIDHLYRFAWNDLVSGVESPVWFGDYGGVTRQMIVTQGFDTWAVNNKNGISPMFFKRPHDLWNQIPPDRAAMRYVEEGVN